jgi:hypothetical protein
MGNHAHFSDYSPFSITFLVLCEVIHVRLDLASGFALGATILITPIWMPAFSMHCIPQNSISKQAQSTKQ